MPKLIGLLGGTFDPVHFGHLRPALDLVQTLSLHQVRFIPNYVPPHRGEPWLNHEQRNILIEMAIAEYPEFILDDRETQREGLSYMIDTLESLRADFPDDRLCLIVGMDAFATLPEWHRWQDILDRCHLIVTSRPGYTSPDHFELKNLESAKVRSVSELYEADSGKILVQSVTQLDISSTTIRELVQSGRNASFLLPDAVHRKLLEFIKS